MDSSGNGYIVGSTNFPVTSGAYQSGPGTDLNEGALHVIPNGFVTKLNSTGSGLAHSTYLHRTASGKIFLTLLIAISVRAGNAYVGGNTRLKPLDLVFGPYAREIDAGPTHRVRHPRASCTGRQQRTARVYALRSSRRVGE